MSKSSEFSKQFQIAVQAKDWNSLETLLTEDVVNQLDTVEKERLAQLFFEQGEHLLENANEPSVMERAYSAFEKCLRLDISSSKSWVKFAEAHLKLALLQQDHSLLIKANELFKHADYLHKTRGSALPLEVLWDWAICLYWIAKESEEAIDFKYAIDKYREAYEGGLTQGAFLYDYGSTLGEMGVLVGKVELLVEAAFFLEKSIQENGDNPPCWLRLACAYKILFFLTGDVAYFEKSDTSFIAAARLYQANENSFELWLNWGQLLSFEGKMTCDSELLSDAMEKLLQADLEKPSDPLVAIAMGDTLTHLGILEERLDWLKEAQEKLEHICKVVPDNLEAICHLSHCLAHIGKYLSDASYLNQSIEKSQMALSQDQKAYHLWHGLSMSYFILAEITNDPVHYEKVAKFCGQAIHLGGDLPGYWNDWGVALMRLGELTNESRYIAEAIEKFEGAIHCFNRKSTGSPDPDWFYNYGCALDWLGDYDLNPQYFERSIAILSRLLDQYPHLHHIQYNLALSLYHLGDAVGDVEVLEKAIIHFESYLHLEPEDDGAFADLGLTYLTYADILQEEISNSRSNEAFLKASDFLTHAIALGNTRANYYLACLHALNTNPKEALLFLERAKTQGSLPSLDDLKHDEWLDSLRSTPEFEKFIKNLSNS